MQEGELTSFEKLESSHWQPMKLLPVWVVVGSLFLSKILQGNVDFHSVAGVRLCSPLYWIIFAAFILICCGVLFWTSKYALNEYHRKLREGYQFTEGDVIWERPKIYYLMLFFWLGGFIASIVGVGGGVIFSPLLLSIDVNPQVAIATALYMETYMVFTTAIQYMIAERVDYLYGLFIALFICIGTLTGLTVISRIVQRLGRTSILIFILVAVLMVACAVTLAIDIGDFKERAGEGTLWDIDHLCS